MSDSTIHDIGEGRLLVFQHGLTADHQQIAGLISPPEACRLISITCPGHGSTGHVTQSDLGFDAYADHIIKIVSERGYKKAVFGGLSMGAGIALNIALRYPEYCEGLILLRPAWLSDPMPENLTILNIAADYIQLARGKQVFMNNTSLDNIFGSLTTARDSLLGIFSPDQHPQINMAIQHMYRDRPYVVTEDLDKITQKCLIIANHDDPLHPFDMAETLARRIKSARLEIIVSRYINHAVHKNQVQKLVEEFMNSLE